MPTNFTVVPVKNGTGKTREEEEDVDGSNVLREEEDPTGEIRFCFLLHLFRCKNMSFIDFYTLETNF